MCKILLSIKPEYVEKIFNGRKKFEYRRTLPKRKVDGVVVYSTYPNKEIIGEFKIKNIHNYKISKLWEISKDKQGITRQDFSKYFKNKTEGYAYEI